MRWIVVLLVLAALAATAAGLAPAPGDGGVEHEGSARVERVVDGDTLVLSEVGKSRLIGVDTPEVHGGAECFGREASAYAKRALAGRSVRYRLGEDPRDRYDRALVYVWTEDGAFFNAALVRDGYATPLTIRPNDEYEARFERLSAEAQRAGRGLWAASACGVGGP